jgi:hypothetical protein
MWGLAAAFPMNPFPLLQFDVLWFQKDIHLGIAYCLSKINQGWVLVAHAYNPSYLGG